MVVIISYLQIRSEKDVYLLSNASCYIIIRFPLHMFCLYG